MIRLGLCCIFRDQPIKFRTTTAAALKKLDRPVALAKLGEIGRSNANALMSSLEYCAANGIGCFRVNSQILPLKTHPLVGFEMADLPEGPEIVGLFERCGAFARDQGVRTCFHPDQFVVLNSPRDEVVVSSIRELEYQAEVAEWIAADVINIHAGGSYGDKTSALSTFSRQIDRLSDRVRTRLTVENDDTTYTPADLLPLCRATGLPLVYDAHHHRCLPDGLAVNEATGLAVETWDREPMFHLSSPIEGWAGPKPQRHHDFIDPTDFPDAWTSMDLTVEVEAKAKELAVARLREELERRGAPIGRGPVARRFPGR